MHRLRRCLGFEPVTLLRLPTQTRCFQAPDRAETEKDLAPVIDVDLQALQNEGEQGRKKHLRQGTIR